MNDDKLTPDNNSTSKLNKSEIIGSFFVKTNEQLAKTIEKRVSDLNGPTVGTEVRITFQFLLFFAAGPDVRHYLYPVKWTRIFWYGGYNPLIKEDYNPHTGECQLGGGISDCFW